MSTAHATGATDPESQPRPSRVPWPLIRGLAMVCVVVGAGLYGRVWQEADERAELNLGLVTAVNEHNIAEATRLLGLGADPNYRPWVRAELPAKSALYRTSFWSRIHSWLGLPQRQPQPGRPRQPRSVSSWAELAEPLQATALTSDVQMARLLLKHGAIADRRYEGTTPLKRALGAAFYQRHAERYTPALRASLRAYVALMLAHGADPNATSFDCTTPLSMAQRLGDSEVEGMLVAAGGIGRTVARPCGR